MLGRHLSSALRANLRQHLTGAPRSMLDCRCKRQWVDMISETDTMGGSRRVTAGREPREGARRADPVSAMASARPARLDLSPDAAQARLDLRKAESGLDAVLGPGSYHDLARVTGLARQHLTRVLRGRSGVTHDAMRKIMRAARIDIAELESYIDRQRAKQAA